MPTSMSFNVSRPGLLFKDSIIQVKEKLSELSNCATPALDKHS